MSSKELLILLVRRSTRFRRYNFLIAHGLTVSLGALVAASATTGVVPQWATAMLAVLFLATAIYLVLKTRGLLPALKPAEAAEELDRSLNGKDRFLTVATVITTHATDAALDAVVRQADRLAAGYNLEQRLPFRLLPPAKHAVVLSPVLLGAALLLMVLRPDVTPAPELRERAEQHAEELRELVENDSTLPPPLREQVLNLADALEERGLLGDDVQEMLDETLEDIQQLTDAAQRE
ncbi:MAG: hypothetical protein KDD44_15320, partial [Bdellovibrionales bacterium]|nr:hypothetical protein [Bdellovibrionales bacterium]